MDLYSRNHSELGSLLKWKEKNLGKKPVPLQKEMGKHQGVSPLQSPGPWEWEKGEQCCISLFPCIRLTKPQPI